MENSPEMICKAKLEAIVPSPFNPRKIFDEVKLKELAESIKASKGLINPIMVRHKNNKLEIISGERRFRAAKLAGFKDIKVIINDIDDTQALEIMVIENLQREDVHPLEEAEGYKTLLKDHGFKTVDDIAVKIGKSRTHVYDRLKLCDLIEENRKLFYENKLSPSIALIVARIPAHLQKEAGKNVSGLNPGINNGQPMSYRQALEYISSEYMLRLKEAGFDTDDAMLVDSAGSCTMCPKRTGNQKELFPDVTSADVCTDPVCFKAKKAAGIQRALAKAKESGKLILSDRDAKKVFFSADSSSLGEGYISLDATCSEDKAGRKYKQLVKLVKDAKVTVGVNPHSGELAAMITRQEASRIRKQLGIVVKNEGENNKPAKAQKTQDSIKEEQQKQIYEKVSAKIVEDVMDNVRKDKDMVFMRSMAEGMLESYATPHTAFMFMKQRKPDVMRGNAVHLLEAHLDKISNAELLGFCLELMIYEGTEFGQPSELANKLCKVYGIDVAAIKKAAAVKEIHIPKVETKAPASEKKTPVKETPAAEEDAHVKMRSGNEFEYGGKNGKKVVVKSKGKLSFDEQKAAGKSLKKVTDLLSEEK